MTPERLEEIRLFTDCLQPSLGFEARVKSYLSELIKEAEELSHLLADGILYLNNALEVARYADHTDNCARKRYEINANCSCGFADAKFRLEMGESVKEEAHESAPQGTN